MASVTFQNVTKRFGKFTAAENLDFEVNDGEFICLLGPSGCGKTTTLRMMAGLETPTEGKILIGDRDVTMVHPKDRDIAMVFQDYALYPHMDLADNISYPLKVRGEERGKRHQEAKRVGDILQIGHLMERMPSQISGGQQQRTSLARALVTPSNVYLFDEPLSNLDAKLRLDARGFLNHLQRDLGITAVYVTHDQAEAMALATRIAVMEKGRIVQFAPPLEIYRRPANSFVANFVGNPPMNLIDCTARIEDGQLRLDAEGLELPPLPLTPELEKATARDKMIFGVRPEHLTIVDGSVEGTITGELFANENMGPEALVTVARTTESRLTARIFTDDVLELDNTVRLGFALRNIHLFDADGVRIPGADE